MYSATLILVLLCTQGDAFFRGSEVERPVLLSRLGVSCAASYPACTMRSWRTSAERPLAPRQERGCELRSGLEVAEYFLATPFTSQDLGFLICETEMMVLTWPIYEIGVPKWNEDSFATWSAFSVPKGEFAGPANEGTPQDRNQRTHPAPHHHTPTSTCLLYASAVALSQTHWALHPWRARSFVFRFSWCFLCDPNILGFTDAFIIWEQQAPSEFKKKKNLQGSIFQSILGIFGTPEVEVRSTLDINSTLVHNLCI